MLELKKSINIIIPEQSMRCACLTDLNLTVDRREFVS